jgi:hypothetical protein
MAEPITGKAKIEWAALRIACPTCGKPMICLEAKAHCTNIECEQAGYPFEVEVPTIDVFLKAKEE